MARSRNTAEWFDWLVVALSLAVGLVVAGVTINNPEHGLKGQVGGLALGGVVSVAVFMFSHRAAR